MLPPLLLEGAERKFPPLEGAERLGLTLLDGEIPLLGVLREGAVLAGGL